MVGLLAVLLGMTLAGAGHAQAQTGFGYDAVATTTCAPAVSTFVTPVTCTVQLVYAPNQYNVNNPGQLLSGPVTGYAALMAFYIDGNVLYAPLDTATGRASVTTSATPTGNYIRAGSHRIGGAFAFPGGNGVGIRLMTENLADITVNPSSTSVSVTASKSTMTYGDSVNLIANVVAPFRRGGDRVDFHLGSASGEKIGTAQVLNGGSAPLYNFTGLRAGNQSIVAVYSGDPLDPVSVPSATSAPVNVNVSKISTAASLQIDNQLGLVVGDTASFTVQVAQTCCVVQSQRPNGVFRVKYGGAVVATGGIADGNGSGTIGPLSLRQFGKTGADHVRFDVEYDGDDTYSAGTGLRAIYLKPASLHSLTVLASAQSVPAGSPVTLTATAHGQGGLTPSGTITFRNYQTGATIGTSTLSNGVASFTFSPAGPPGNLPIAASYGGDVDFAASGDVLFDLAIRNPAAQIALTLSNAAPTFGSPVTLTATVTGTNPIGNVTFRRFGNSLGTVALANGVATLTLSDLPGGSHSLTAFYAGDGTHSSNTSAPVTINVAPVATTTACKPPPPARPSADLSR